ncbi:hypothetical protein C3Y87_09160 [Carbonactinospora thermoautotrophica]|uniref:Uncharacterized protein n=1 Tax=Carbonactinospora thermoautotrophica TaxID=1469144 RepID=A0A132NED2_9ACTN|nr:hypothetical protein [Carbonactinospora thermoautotrophica]KWW99219.1 hypothetical protein LI90_853 [Carbonactinospora thermoautotrophica]KWX05010.1 hypothetical protein TH66_04420 [Carbonactinospora thermoautotrophica]KWX08418.1 hypothetical protein TR74_15120 [Carbonactinospora thermoautotrophica]MCX9191579.1 hypothetical protein [Carbonactinospora thermoautotrophica]
MTLVAYALLLAQNQEVPVEKVSPGLLGFLIVAVLGVVTWLLIKSMNKQIRRIDFEESQRPAQRPDQKAE